MVDEVLDVELISGSFETVPHKRFEFLFGLENKKYDKAFHGEGVAYDIRLSQIRAKAKRFKT